VISTIYGGGVYGFPGVGSPASASPLGNLSAIALDSAGNLFFSDQTNDVVWEVSANTGTISIVAGDGTKGYSGDGGPATSAELWNPSGVVADESGNLYIADSSNNVVRRVAAGTGLITTVAGNGQAGSQGPFGDGGPAIAAQIYGPTALALDTASNLYIADSGHNLIRFVSASTGLITTIAGSQNGSSLGDGGPATSANLGFPDELAVDNAGNIYIATSIYNFGGRVRKVTASTGIITTVAGNGNLQGESGDGGPATNAEIYPQAIAVDLAGNLYISNRPGEIREVSASTGIITRVAGNGYYGYSGDGGSATVAELKDPAGIAFDSAGDLYIADSNNYRIRKVTFPGPAPSPILSLAAGTYTTAQTVTITDPAQGATVYYTTDGTTPTTGSTVYSGAITISSTTTLQAIAVAKGYTRSAVASAVYTIHLPVIGTAAATVTLTPSAAIITNQQPVSVAVSVAGSGQTAPTGTITLAGGPYSVQQPLASGTTTFNISTGALSAGSVTLTASYSGDAVFATASGTTTITVAPVVIAASNPAPVAPGGSVSTTAAFAAGSNYSGTMNLTCALTASPTGAQSLPTCSLNPASVTISPGGNATTTVTVKTIAASTSSASVRHWWNWSGSGVVALALIFGVPSWRRRRALMMAILCGIGVAGMIGCGGGGSSSNSQTSTPATTAGSYTFSLSGTDATNAKITASTNVTVTVQ
jgi:hypothetical protein